MKNLTLYIILFLFFISNSNFFEPFRSLLPTSGSEPHFKPTKWNTNSFVKTNNCYAYFLDDLDSRDKKPQPGDFAGVPGTATRNSSTCAQTISRIQEDNPAVYKVDKQTPCQKGYYKGYLAIDPGKDYHFYRQDSNGLFSHKPGKNPVTKYDASGELITDPELSDRNFMDINFNYSESCGFLCVPTDAMVKTNSK